MFKEIKWKIKLYKYILEVSESQVNSYSDDIKKNIELINSDDEEISNKTIIDIRNKYLERVFRIVLEYISQEKFEIYDEIKKIMEKPAICGYEDINLEMGTLAGAVYAMCYYAMTKKVAKPQDCIELNHLQNEIMRQAMLKLDKEL